MMAGKQFHHQNSFGETKEVPRKRTTIECFHCILPGRTDILIILFAC